MIQLLPDGVAVPLNLPTPSDEPLEQSPLALVVFQLLFSAPLSFGALTAANISTRLAERGFDFAKSEPMQTLSINIQGLGGPAESSGMISGWKLQSSDNAWSVTLSNGSVSLETPQYRSWENDFRARIEAVLEAVAHFLKPEAETRLGLRFVDLVTHPDVSKPADWRGRISDWLLAPIVHDGVGSAIKTMQQQLNLEIGDGVQANVRLGTYPDNARGGEYTFVLDCDVFRNRIRAFDLTDVLETADAFHTVALALFQSMITPNFHNELKPPA